MYIIDRDPIALKIAKLREPLGDLPREKLDEIAREVRGLQHELHCATLSYTGAIDEVRKLRAELDAARADALALATERNRWQAMYNDAMAELDAAGRACKAALLADYTHAPPGVYGTVRAVANRLFDAALREDKP